MATRGLALRLCGIGIVVAIALGACSSDPKAAPVSPGGRWDPIAKSILSPRRETVNLWTGTEVLIIGGITEPHCSGDDCAARVQPNPSSLQRDGAAYNPKTNKWRKIAPAPEYPYGDAVWTGSAALMLAKSGLLEYTPQRDVWRNISDVPKDVLASNLGSPAWTGSQWIFIIGGTDFDAAGKIQKFAARYFSYEPRTNRWNELPSTLSGGMLSLVYAHGWLYVFGIAGDSNEAVLGANHVLSLSAFDFAKRVWSEPKKTPIFDDGERWTTWGDYLINGNPGAATGGLSLGGRYDIVHERWVPMQKIPEQWVTKDGRHGIDGRIPFVGPLGDRYVWIGGLYDPVKDRWTQATRWPYRGSAMVGVAIDDRRIFAWGGVIFGAKDTDSQVMTADGAIYTIGALPRVKLAK